MQLLWRCTRRLGFRRLWLVVGALVICGFASGAMAAEPTKPAAEASKVAAPKEATLVVWNQAITSFRSSFGGLNATRAGGTSGRAHSGVAPWQ